MKILIDTNVLIWILYGSRRLGSASQKLLSSSESQIFVSYISLYEIAIKAASSGRLTYNDTVFDKLAEVGVELIYPSRDALKDYRIYNPTNKDPFDNFLIAVAQTEQCSFMTSGTRILSTKSSVKLLDARL